MLKSVMVVLAVAVVLAGGILLSTDVQATGPSGSVTVTSVTCGAGDADGNVEVTINVNISADLVGQKWKDLHLNVPDTRDLAKPIPPNDDNVTTDVAGVADQKWKVKRNSKKNHIAVYSKKGFTKKGNYTMKLKLAAGVKPGDMPDLATGTWTLTNDGNDSYKSGVIVNDNDNEATGETNRQLPIVIAMVNNDQDFDCPVAVATTFSAESTPTHGGMAYEIYSSIEVADECDDELGIGIRSVTHPVPIEWMVNFEHFEGLLSPAGTVEPAPSIRIDNLGAAGSEFYIVLVLKQGEEILGSSEPVKVRIMP